MGIETDFPSAMKTMERIFSVHDETGRTFQDYIVFEIEQVAEAILDAAYKAIEKEMNCLEDGSFSDGVSSSLGALDDVSKAWKKSWQGDDAKNFLTLLDDNDRLKDQNEDLQDEVEKLRRPTRQG